MLVGKKRKNEVNRGKTCKVHGCSFTARTKGYCTNCYTKNYQKKMTYAESGVNVEREEIAIKGILSDIKKQRKNVCATHGGHYAGMIEFDEV